MTRRVIEVLPPDVSDTRRKLATAWLAELYERVHSWNGNFVKFLKQYPGFREECNPDECRKFFEKLLEYQTSLDDRHEEVKTSLCAPLKRLHARFLHDFEWLRQENPKAFEVLFNHVTNAYRSEVGIIDSARLFVDRVLGWEAPANTLPPDQRIQQSAFLRWHSEHPAATAELIRGYENKSAEFIRSIRETSEAADIDLVPIEDYEARRRPERTSHHVSVRITESDRRPQLNHAHTYRLLAFAFGATFLVSVMVFALLVSIPTPFQLRVFTSVLALSVAGVATVMTGLLDVRATLGKQIAIGASGGLAAFVIVYLINPAVL